MTSLVSIYRRFPTHDAAGTHLEFVRWPHGPVCPYCGAAKAARKNDATRGLTARRWQRWGCDRSFSVTVGTIFHNSHVDLQRWFLLIGLMLNAKKGLSSSQAARDLDMRQPTVWSMMHRIRTAMGRDAEAGLLTSLVEIDETFVGGKPRKANHRDDDRPGPRGRGISKQPVVGAVERGGRMKAKVTLPRGERR
ncbi:MAG: IS1595 family transposase [Sphingomonadaceae bacterium]|nr:IS1595 family transposase [Sphingomonadaceae bacterium]